MIYNKIAVSEKFGEISYELSETTNPKYILTLAHGAGAGMTHPFLFQLSQKLADRGAIVVRFNFPYKEEGKKLPGSPKPNIETINKISTLCQEKFPDFPIYLGGKSYGGRMSSHFVAENPEAPINGLIYFGFPLHSPGKPDMKRAEHLFQIKIPQLFLQGTNDALADIHLISEIVNKISQTTLVKFENADHSFKVPRKLNGKSIDNMIEDLATTADLWIKNHLN